MKTPKCYTWLESCGSHLSGDIKEKIFFCILQSVRFSMTVRTDIFLYTEKLSHLALMERVAEKARLRHHLFRGGNCPPLPLILLIDVVDNEKVARVESRSRWNCPRVLALTTLSARLIVTNAIFHDKRRHFRWRHVWLLYQQRTRHFWSLGFSAEDNYWEADADICFKFQLIMSTMMDGLVSRSGSGLFWL